ncbi:MAG TPA: PilZ domain-containing protein [Pyrinomonadaceae bacterium]|nr:PilZ domain-containing protein [Pyrinomonadaceae bacterium]
MSRQFEPENRQGPRYLATIEVRAEWEDSTGTHVVADGITENVGPEGTLVHLPKQLPQVGSRVRLEVHSEDGRKLQVVAEVLRIERNPGHPLAALYLLGETDEWRGLIWEPAAPKIAEPQPAEEEDDEEDQGESPEEVTN